MTEELGAVSVGLGVSLGTLDRDLARIKKQIEPIERDHKIPFSVGRVSFAEVQKEIEAIAKKQIPVQLMAAPGSGRAIHKQLTAQLNAAGPVPVRIKANLSVTEVTRIRAEISKVLSKTPIPLRVTTAPGSAAPAAPPPAAGRARPQPPVVASAPAAAPVSPAPPTRQAVKTTPPAASPSAATPTPAQPTPPPAARASTRAQRAQRQAASVPETLDIETPRHAMERRAAAQKPAAPAATPTPRAPRQSGDRRMTDPNALREMIGNLQRQIDKDPKNASVPAWKKTQGDLQRALDGLAPVDPATVEAAKTATKTASSRPKTAKEKATSEPARTVGATPNLSPSAPTPPTRKFVKPPSALKGAPKPTAAAPVPEVSPVPAAAPAGPSEDAEEGFTWETARAKGKVIDVDREDLPLPKRREARRFRRRADPHYGEQLLETESAKLTDLRSKRLKAETDEDKRRLSAEVRKQKAVVERAKKMASGVTAETMTPEQQEAARERWERNQQLRNVGRTSPIWYGDLSKMDPRLRRQIDIAQLSKIDPVMTEAYEAIQRGDLDMAKGVLQGLGLSVRGPSGTRARRRFGKLFRNVEKVSEPLLLKDATLRSLYEEIKVLLDPNYVNKPSADYVPSSGKKGGPGGPQMSDADRDLAAANRGEMTPEELYARHPEWASLDAPRTPWQPSTELSGPAPRRKLAKLGTVVKTKSGRERIVPQKDVDPTTLPYRKGKPGYQSAPEPEAKGRVFVPPPIDLVAEDKRRTMKALEEAVQDAIEGSVPASKAQLNKLAAKYKKREAGGPLLRRIREAAERKAQADQVLVGEKRPEVYVSNRGEAEVVGEKGPEIRSFPEGGEIVPSIPEWRRRLKAKDLTGYEGGGRIRKTPARSFSPDAQAKFWAKQNAELEAESAKIRAQLEAAHADLADQDAAEKARLRGQYLDRTAVRGDGFVMVGGPRSTGGGSATPRYRRPPTPPQEPRRAPERQAPAKPPEYEGRFGAEPGSGLKGRKEYRDSFDGERKAVAEGKLSPSGSVQRVFVTNWPAGGGRFSGQQPLVNDPHGLGIAAGPMRGGRATPDALGELLKKILGETKKVEAEEPEKTDTVRPTPLTPEERINARLEAIGGSTPRQLRQQLTNIKSNLSETTAQSPVRSLAPAFGQIVGTMFGRGELLKRLATARDLTAQATRAYGIYNAEHEKELKLSAQLAKAETPEQKEQLTAALDDQSKATNAAWMETSKLKTEALEAAKAADAFSLKLGTMVGNTVGIIGGTLAFGATLAVAQGALTAVGTVMTPVVERMTGYQNVTAGVTKSLAEQTREHHGAVQSTVALATANAALGKSISGTVSPLLEQRAAVEAGNLAIADSVGLVMSAIQINRQNAGAGADKGLFATTGGWFGSNLGGIPSTQEQFVNLMNQNLPGLKQLQSRQDPRIKNAPMSAAGDAWFKASNASNPQLAGKSLADVTTGLESDLVKGLEDGAVVVDLFNSALDKAGARFKIDMAKASDSAADLAQRQSDAAISAKAFNEAGLLDTAKMIEETGLVVRRANGQLIATADEAREFYGEINKGFQTPSVESLIKQMTDRIVPAQRALFSAQAQFQRQTLQPAQTALNNLASPTPGLAGGPAFDAGLVGVAGGKADKAARAAGKTYRTEVGGAIEFVNREIEVGQRALMDLVPANLRTEFGSLLDDITATGQQISRIQTGIQQQQVNLQVAEYNNQLRIARRSLADARDLQAGIAGATRNTLGGIEGQNIAIQRQLQLLGFELQQRQINFRLATAGFVTPGATPEEIAARIKEAKIEADYAQKQLDLQKQLAANQFKAVRISADRNVTDLLAQISLLQQGKEVVVNTAAASRSLDVLNKKQQILLERAGTYIEEGTKITAAAMEAAADVSRATGKAFSEVLNQTANAWGIFGEQAQLILNALRGTAPGGGNDGRNDGGFANGIVGDTLGPTQITVGEAAGEKVAVLKNPKLVPSSSLGINGGGGGSAPNITIVISGNTFRDREDIEELVDRVKGDIVDEVMDRFQRRASLILR